MTVVELKEFCKEKSIKISFSGGTKLQIKQKIRDWLPPTHSQPDNCVNDDFSSSQNVLGTAEMASLQSTRNPDLDLLISSDFLLPFLCILCGCDYIPKSCGGIKTCLRAVHSFARSFEGALPSASTKPSPFSFFFEKLTNIAKILPEARKRVPWRQ